MTVEVLDMSGAQPAQCNFQETKDAGIAGIWYKASEGVDFVDSHFKKYCADARSVGQLYSAYHYIRVRRGQGANQDGVKQAQQFCELYTSNYCYLPPMYDVEGMNNTYYMENGQPKFYDPAPTVLEWQTVIRQFRSTVQALLKKRLLIYTDKGEWDSFKLPDFVDVTGDDLWIAQITSGEPTIPKPFTSYKLHQYSWNGQVPGIAGAVDRSRYNGSQSDFDEWAGTGGGWSIAKAIGVSALGVMGLGYLKSKMKK